jgi:molybdopterin-guanine dinucleotide biosynthesis protein B
MHELRGEDEPRLEAVIARLSPADLILIEGYKREGHPKIEVRRASANARERLPPDPSILAVAGDYDTDAGALPFFHLDDVGTIADFIESAISLKRDA